MALCILLVAVLSACSSGGTAADTTKASDTTKPDDGKKYDANGYLLDQIPSDLNYNNATIKILATKEQLPKTFVENETGERLNDALYSRIRTVEERLGVTLEFISQPGQWNDRESFMATVQNSVSAGTQDYDLIMAYNLIPPTLAVRGVLEDLKKTKYLDFDMPWWPQNIVNESTVEGKLFFAIDNSSWGSIRNMACIMFNKKLAANYNLSEDYLYDLALSGQWTLDKLEELINGMYVDLNNDGARNYGDLYGFSNVDNPRLDALFYSTGLKIVSRNSTGEPVLNLGQEKVTNVLERLTALFHDNKDVWLKDESMYTMFKNDQVVFYLTPIAIVDQQLELEFGVLPNPKWDLAQEGYITYMSNTHDAWCITTDAKDADMSSAVLECLSSEAYRKIAPEYFETILKYRYASDQTSAKVYDIIRDSATCDFGYIYGNSFSYAPFLLFRECIQSNNRNWSSVYATYKDSFETQLKTIMDALKAA